MEKIYHHFDLWEDFKAGMYQKSCFMDDEVMVGDCQSLLACSEWLEEAMFFVTHIWLYASEQNLSNISRNRQAWLGQAACCMVHGAPEYLTKIAWNRLTRDQQDLANSVADTVIKDWEEKHHRGYWKWLKSELGKTSCKQLRREYH